MKRRGVLIGIGMGVLLAAGYLFFSDGTDEHERAIAARIEGFAVAVENRDKAAFMEGLAPDFRPVGRYLSSYGTSMVVDRVWQITGSIQPVDVEIYDLDIEVGDKALQAMVTFHVRLIGAGQPSGVSPEQMERSKVNLRLYRYGDRWLVTEAGVGVNAFSGWGGTP